MPNYLNAQSEQNILKGAYFYAADLLRTLNQLKSKLINVFVML